MRNDPPKFLMVCIAEFRLMIGSMGVPSCERSTAERSSSNRYFILPQYLLKMCFCLFFLLVLKFPSQKAMLCCSFHVKWSQNGHSFVAVKKGPKRHDCWFVSVELSSGGEATVIVMWNDNLRMYCSKKFHRTSFEPSPPPRFHPSHNLQSEPDVHTSLKPEFKLNLARETGVWWCSLFCIVKGEFPLVTSVTHE